MGAGLFQPMHLLVILIIVFIIFGAGKLPEVGKALGQGIKEFKQANDEPVSSTSSTSASTASTAPVGPTAPVASVAPVVPPAAVAPGTTVTTLTVCARCQAVTQPGQRFCSSCGAPLAATA